MKHLVLTIKKDLKEHPTDYLVLFTLGVIFLILLRVFQGQKILSLVACSAFVVGYIVWSAHHHGKYKILEFKNMVEYILIGTTILFLILLLI